MSENSKDQLIETQKQIIGILFEVVKRFQANNELDEEYFHLVSDKNITKQKEKRLEEILTIRTENAKIIGRLLEKFES